MASNRRTPGLSAFSRNTITTAQYALHGSQLRSNHLSSLQTQLSVFKSLLQQFSITHGKEIRSNPTFRAEFARMCNAIGVDPLVSSNTRKGSNSSGGSFWAQMLGGSVNDFYFGLAVIVVEVCRETRAENGGMIAVNELAKRVQERRGEVNDMEVTDDDILRAVRSLEPLSSGIVIKQLGSKQMVRSIPKELNNDQAVVLEAIQVLGFVTLSMLQINLRWERERAKAVIDDLIADSLVWLDEQAEECEYWSPAFLPENGTASLDQPL